MLHQPLQLRGTVQVDAFNVCRILPDSGLAAYRTDHRDLKYCRSLRTLLRHFPDAFGNHITGFFDQEGGAQADVQFRDIVLVVKGAAGVEATLSKTGQREWARPRWAAQLDSSLPLSSLFLLLLLHFIHVDEIAESVHIHCTVL